MGPNFFSYIDLSYRREYTVCSSGLNCPVLVGEYPVTFVPGPTMEEPAQSNAVFLDFGNYKLCGHQLLH